VPPIWLQWISWVALVIAIGSAVWILIDVYGRGHRQRMGVMEAVWPVTALYLGPVAVWAYRRFGRPNSPRWTRRHGQPAGRPGWVPVALGVSHCGAGCTLGDIVAEFAVFALGLSIAGEALYAEFVGDYLVAVLLGVVFQYLAIAPMRGLSPGKGLLQAAKADVLSLTAFEVGLFGWMALMRFVFFPDHPLHPDSPVYWFLMQVGMVLGFATAWPANAWLIQRGMKEAM
jgi:hypothetical protein